LNPLDKYPERPDFTPEIRPFSILEKNQKRDMSEHKPIDETGFRYFVNKIVCSIFMA